MHKLRYRLHVMKLAATSLFRRTYVANICGHRTKREGQLDTFGERFTVIMPLAENGKPDYCLACINGMAIRCAWCGNGIHIGDPVTLYAPKDSFEVPAYAVRYDKDPARLVGCLRWDCANSGADRQGFWMPPGKVMRVPSPIEMLLASENQGKAIIINNLADPNDLGRIITGE